VTALWERPYLDILDAAARKPDLTASHNASPRIDDRHDYCKIIMEHRDLKYLSALTRAGSFARAARSLGINASTISRRIGRLEDELGLSLFERKRTGSRLTAGGKAVMIHVRRALAELEAIKCTGGQNGSGSVGEIRLGVRMPPIGEPLCGLLAGWHAKYPEVALTISEMNECEIASALNDRRLDVAFMTSHTLWPHAAAVPIYRERLTAALPLGHVLAEREAVDWTSLRDETFLVQGWDESQSAREFYASFLGSGTRFRAHAASKQSVFALVAAGFGVTLATESQSEAVFPGIIFRPIVDANAWVQVELAWLPDIEDAAVGRFVAFLRDEVYSRRLL
jgi:DNA-binding transcriptional LysR family regulator